MTTQERPATENPRLAAGTDVNTEDREALFATVGPAVLMYHCLSGQDKSTDEQIESVVDTVLLPLLHA